MNRLTDACLRSPALSTMEVGAQTWPTKPRGRSAVGAGSTTEIVPRVVPRQLSRTGPEHRRGKP